MTNDTEPSVIRTATVLDEWHLEQYSVGGGQVRFWTNEERPTPMVELPIERWNDLGRPTTVTVIIEHGDTINDTPPWSLLWGDQAPVTPYDATVEDDG